MQRQMKWLISITIVLAVLVGVLLVFDDEDKKPVTLVESLLVNKELEDVLMIQVENESDGFVVRQENGGFIFSDIDAQLLNLEYVQQLIADSVYVEYLELVKENADDLNVFGLDSPVSTVMIQYKGDEKLELWIGDPGPKKNTRYVLDKNDGNVYLFNESATIRFTMSVDRYIDFIIVPPHEISDVMRTIKSVTYQGKMLKEPIVIEMIDVTNETQLRAASSFGVASHLMLKPTLQKLDLGEAINQFKAIVGLLNYGVADYNVTAETLKEYGFDDPELLVHFEFSPDGVREATPYQLKITKKDNQYFAMVNNNGVIHKIEDEAFLHLTYEKMISRWFYTPLLLDIEQLSIKTNQKTYDIVIEKPSKNEIDVSINGKVVDSEAFRKFYNLIVSASHDGIYQPFEKSEKNQIMQISFNYIDPLKEDDVITYYSGDARRNNVCYSNVCEFAIRDTYVEYVETAILSLLAETSFRSDWQ